MLRPAIDGSLPTFERTDQMVRLSDPGQQAPLEAAPLEHPLQLEIGVRAVNGMYDPLDAGELVAARVALAQGGEEGKSPFSSTFDLGELDDEVIRADPELA